MGGSRCPTFFLSETPKSVSAILCRFDRHKKPGARPGAIGGAGAQSAGFTTAPFFTNPLFSSAPTTAFQRSPTRSFGTSAKAGCWVQNAFASAIPIAPPGGSPIAAQHAAARPFRRTAGCGGGAGAGAGSAALGGASTGLAVGAGAGTSVMASNTKRDKSPLSPTRSVCHATLRR